MNRLELARYLKIGSTSEFTYNEPEFTFDYNITFEDAKEKLRELVKKRIESFPVEDSFLYFSGTHGACVLLDLIKKIPTLSMNLDNNVKAISDYYGVNNHMFEWDDIEDMVMEHQTEYIGAKPRCWSLDDIYGWVRARNAVNMGLRSSICEGGGAEWVLFGDPNRAHAVMKLAVHKKEYLTTRAMLYKKKTIARNDQWAFSKYLKCFTENVSIFKDNELIDLGLPVPEFKLRKENLEHLTQAAHDWGYNYIVKENDQPCPEFFGGYKIYYVFFDNPELTNFILSLPMEMKYNLGRTRHIFKETFKLPKEILPLLSENLFPHIISKIKPWAMKAGEKYLDKNNRVWEYMEYDKAKKYFGDFLKFWQLLNLSIWINENKSIS